MVQQNSTVIKILKYYILYKLPSFAKTQKSKIRTYLKQQF